MNIVALAAFRDASGYLPRFLGHLRGYVDGVILLDDRSRDNLGGQALHDPLVLDVIFRRDPDPTPHKFESENREALLRAALARQADWVLCLDVDERVESGFLKRLPEIAQGDQVFALRQREMWDAEHYRVDGYWGQKRKPILFRSKPFDAYHPPGCLHRRWMPPGQEGPEVWLDWNLYHLGMIGSLARQERLAKFTRIDPDHRHQKDYGYLVDEVGMVLEKVPDGRW